MSNCIPMFTHELYCTCLFYMFSMIMCLGLGSSLILSILLCLLLLLFGLLTCNLALSCCCFWFRLQTIEKIQQIRFVFYDLLGLVNTFFLVLMYLNVPLIFVHSLSRPFIICICFNLLFTYLFTSRFFYMLLRTTGFFIHFEKIISFALSFILRSWFFVRFINCVSVMDFYSSEVFTSLVLLVC